MRILNIGFCWCALILIVSMGAQLAATTRAESQMSTPATVSENWREIKEGVDGYIAGPMLEIALRRTQGDKLEMFRWRSEFISMLSAQPGPLVEREWESLAGMPAIEGAGTWTGMTWWDNQQSWHDMANMLFPSPVTSNWLQTINMTLIFVKPLDGDFDLSTLAQSGGEILELGILVFPNAEDAGNSEAHAAAQSYLDAVESVGGNAYRFGVYPNPAGFNGPYTAAYKQNGMPGHDEGEWYVYMVSYPSQLERGSIHQSEPTSSAFAALRSAVVPEKSDIQIMTRSTSKVCCKSANICSVDPGECSVGILGMGDTWAGNCSQCPRPCETGHGICSNLSPATCSAVGGTKVASCAAQ